MAGGLVATAAAIADAPVRREELRGFQCFHWTAGGLRYFLVGDVAEEAMTQLAARMAAP
jgi:anti-sigma factor RsiW